MKKSVLVLSALTLVATGLVTTQPAHASIQTANSDATCIKLGSAFLRNLIAYQRGIGNSDITAVRKAVKAEYKLLKSIKDSKTRSLLEDVILLMDGSNIHVSDSAEFGKWQSRQIIAGLC